MQVRRVPRLLPQNQLPRHKRLLQPLNLLLKLTNLLPRYTRQQQLPLQMLLLRRHNMQAFKPHQSLWW